MENYLILLTGLPGAGKTTTASRLFRGLENYILIDQNEIRREYGIKKMPKTQEEILRAIDLLTLKNLLDGHGVIYESGNRYSFRRHQMYGIAGGCGTNVVTLEVICSEKESKKRIKSRPKADNLISDPRDPKVYDRIKKLWEPVEIDFKYPGEDHVSHMIYNTEKNKIETPVITKGMKDFLNQIKRILI